MHEMGEAINKNENKPKNFDITVSNAAIMPKKLLQHLKNHECYQVYAGSKCEDSSGLCLNFKRQGDIIAKSVHDNFRTRKLVQLD